MDIAFKPPVLMFFVLGALLLVVVLAALLKKMEPWKKGLTAAAGVVLCVAIGIFTLRTTHLVVDDAGIRATTYGTHTIAWADVRKAVVVNDLPASPWALVARTGGTALGDFKAGWFRLQNGTKAFVTTEIKDRALVIETSAATWVLAPRDFDAFVAQVSRHATVTETTGGQS